MRDNVVGVLIFPNFQLLDAAGPAAVFEVSRQFSGRQVSIRPLALAGGLVRSSCGVEMYARAIKRAGVLDTLIVVGGAGTGNAVLSDPIIAFVKSAARRARRVASVCSGAYVLAEAGLLDGRRATTHWSRSNHFLATYPQVRLEPDRIFVKDDNIWTSAGISAGIDLALAMVAEDCGEAVAKETARYLVVYHTRSGGQSQFSTLLELKSPTSRFGPMLAWVREHLDEQLTVERLADYVHMSSRNFTRTFSAEMGMSPTKAVERLRIEVAKARVETNGEPIESVARSTGFGDPERMRRAFIRAFGQPPQSLRRSARR
jgi:transcriptional regulator GlxA family with amidase domain